MSSQRSPRSSLGLSSAQKCRTRRFGTQIAKRTGISIAVVVFLAPALAGCTTDGMTTGSVSKDGRAAAIKASASERECLIRAMYFESNRSSEDGMLAVGSVVMNRVASPKFPNTICGVVGQPNQFASGVLSRKMSSSALPKIEKVADEVLAGKRHAKVGPAMFFHTAGLTFPYDNMHYVAVAGGNAFYQKIAKSDRVKQATTAVAAATNIPLPAPRPDSAPAFRTAYAEGTGIDNRVDQAFASFSD